MVGVVGHFASYPDTLQPGIIKEFFDDGRELRHLQGCGLPPGDSSGLLNQSINNY